MSPSLDLSTSLRLARWAAIAVAMFCLASAASAGAAAPGLRALGMTAPAHLPPRQSEVQQITVEAEGGTFSLASVSEGKGTPVVVPATLSYTTGSPVATIDSIGSGGKVEVGDRVVATTAGGYPERTIVSCSTDCRTPGSTITVSESFESTAAKDPAEIFTKALSGVTGTFHVGDVIEFPEFPPYVPEGTTVTGVAGDEITLSAPTDFFYESSAGAISFRGVEKTAPIAFDAPAATLQGVLEALPAVGSGSVTVIGGPGGELAHPYYLEFGGGRADQDVPSLVAESQLTGSAPAVRARTTVPGGPGRGVVVGVVANVGGASTSGPITMKIGPLPPGVAFSAVASGEGWTCVGGAGAAVAECTTINQLTALNAALIPVHAPVEVQAGGSSEGSVPIEVSGGSSARPDTYRAPVVVSPEPAKFGIAALLAGAFDADGNTYTQAGGHPFSASAYVLANTVRTAAGTLTPAGDARSIEVDLPPGLVGNPLVTKRCPQSTLVSTSGGSELCNEEARIGQLVPFIGSVEEPALFPESIYSNVPPRGYAGEFSGVVAVPIQSILASVNSEEDFGLRLEGQNIATTKKFFGIFVSFEGVPKFGSGLAFLTAPTNCAETRERQLVVRGNATTYQEPDSYYPAYVVQPPVTGCEKLQFTAFDPATGKGQVSFSFLPTSNTGSSPVGATAHLHIDEGGLTDPNGLTTPELKRAAVDLPQGLSLNPSAANGLQGCSEAQIGYKGSGFPMPNPIRFDEAQPTCPDGSKLGTAEVKTPLLDNPLVGTIYLAAQEENPFDALLGVYLVVNDPFTGVLIKLPGNVQADPVTGRLRAVFDDTPQLPFEDLTIRFGGGGGRSEFATSEVCGDVPTEGEFTPWSAPESGPPARTRDSFSISSGCSSSPAARPFAPRLTAGTTGNKAGAFSPLVLAVSRNDGEQELSSVDFDLPAGLIGKLAGVSTCPDGAIAAAEGKSGKAERAAPSCPANSRLGTVDAAAGVGSEPVHVGGDIYLAGPYRGAPLSVVVITPAVAGPFDLGDVVIRAPIRIDPESTALSVRSDPIPTILRGIPLKLRSVTLSIDRPGFALNPTNCATKSISAQIGGGSGATAKPSARFQAIGCAALRFAPKLKIALKGKTKRGGHPAVTAILTQPPGQANIGRVSVALPRSEFLEQGHIRKNCTRVQFAAGECPAGSIYGHAEAVTPLLDQPLIGPVYLRSSSHKLPDLAVVLRGPASQPIEIDLDGRIDSFKGGIRTTFETVPDAPVSKFVLRLPAGKKSLLVNSTNICKGKHKARVQMTGQNGVEHDFATALEPQCGTKSEGKHGGRKHR